MAFHGDPSANQVLDILTLSEILRLAATHFLFMVVAYRDCYLRFCESVYMKYMRSSQIGLTGVTGLNKTRLAFPASACLGGSNQKIKVNYSLNRV